MSKLQVLKDQTSKRIGVFIQDSAATTGVGKAGLTFASANLTWYYWRESDGNVAGTSVTLATMTRGTWATGGFVEKDATNMPGFYELGIPNAALATGANWVTMVIRDSAAALGIAPCTIEIQLMDALPTPPENVWSVATRQLTGTQTFNNTGTWTGNLSGSVGSVTGAVGSVTGAVGSVTGSVGSVAGNVTGTVASVVGNVGGNVTGSVGSVLGNVAGTVASVVGNVGGNVVGSVASVTGAVGSVTGAVGSVAAGGITAASIATGAVDADALATDAVSEIADGVWDEVLSGHLTVGTYGQVLQAIRTGTAQAGAAGTITLDASASASDDFYKNAIVFITSGTGASQCRTISGYTGGTKVATITPNWITNPAVGSIFVILPVGAIAGASAPTVGEVADAVWDEARAGHVGGGSFGEGVASVQGNVTGSAASVTGAVGSVTGAVGSVTGAVGSVTGSVGSVAAGGITAASIATGAVDADALAADAGTEIGTAVWATAARTLTAGTNIVLAKGVGVTGFTDLSAAQVNAEVVDAIGVDTMAQLPQAAPASTPTVKEALMNLYMWQRNKTTETATLAKLFDEAGTTCLQKRTISDDLTTFTAEEIATGP